jgi:uncharacterized protein YjbI with pentapeptide repeats
MVGNGHRLWGSEIVGQDLTNASFDDCNLNGVTLRQCNLTGATFRRAVFDGFRIDDCEFGANDFTGAALNGLRDTDYRVALPLSLEQWKSTWSFKNKNLNDCEIAIRDAGQDSLTLDLRGFQLLRTKFYGLDLSTTRFDGARFYQIEMHDCRLNFERFQKETSGTISGCKFFNTEFLGHVDFQGSIASSVISGPMPSVDASQVDIYNLYAGRWLDREALTETKSYLVGNLHGCRFGSSDFAGVDFSRQLLSYAMFAKCDLDDCKFDDAVISFARFRDCRGLTAEQIKSTWNYRHNRMEGIELPPQVAQELGK